MAARLKTWARALKRDVHAVYLAARDPRTPWYAKALALAVAGYALSPDVLAEHRALADAASSRPVSRSAAAAIVAIWIVAACALAWLSRRYLFETHD